jgi:hypothetical protein
MSNVIQLDQYRTKLMVNTYRDVLRCMTKLELLDEHVRWVDERNEYGDSYQVFLMGKELYTTLYNKAETLDLRSLCAEYLKEIDKHLRYYEAG